MKKFLFKIIRTQIKESSDINTVFEMNAALLNITYGSRNV